MPTSPSAGAIYITLPINVQSLTNQRAHWGKKARLAKEAREVAALAVRPRLTQAFLEIARREGVSILLTRRGPRHLDDDNLAASLKSVRDGIADALGIDDGDARLRWYYDQEHAKRPSVGIVVREHSRFSLARAAVLQPQPRPVAIEVPMRRGAPNWTETKVVLESGRRVSLGEAGIDLRPYEEVE